VRTYFAVIALVSAALCATPAFARMDSNKFAKEAAEGGMAEVQMGKLAADKGTDSDVKSFGQKMVDDHSKANDELKSLAAKKGIALPQDLSKKHKSTQDKLSKLSGAKFDKAYMKDMVDDHEKDVKAFRKQAKEGSDADIKAFAEKTLPTLESHLDLAKSTYKKLK
jgi:putative membrane protein